MSEIINRVEKSGLIQIDLADYYTHGKRTILDIKPWLFEELILKEKDFRDYVKNHDWNQYQDHFVSVICSVDVIVPSWAYLLIAIELESIAKKVVFGNTETMETILFEEYFNQFDFVQYQDKMLIVKGCGHLPIPQQAYMHFIIKAKPFAKSIMFGEPCSAVPLYKRSKK
ncbi:DUF2480 family protein [bacterium SCSIO 12643]|nr:DUF2480 family protein [bacterium SCSIO 12643]